MAWVGGANEASGATKTLSGVLNGVAGNIDNVATAAGRWLPSGLPGTLAIWPRSGVCHGRTCDGST